MRATGHRNHSRTATNIRTQEDKDRVAPAISRTCAQTAGVAKKGNPRDETGEVDASVRLSGLERFVAREGNRELNVKDVDVSPPAVVGL